VTPDFLDAVLDQVQEAGLDIVSLDEAVRRLPEEDERRFVCFTFDDGYRDNLEYAHPLFKKRSLPITLYVPTDYPDGDGELWWIALEEIISRAGEIELCRNGALWKLPAGTVQEKYRAYDEIYWWLRLIDEAMQRQIVRTLADRYEIDMAADCRRLIMDWDEIRTMAADPLVTIGAHTKGHFAISKLSAPRALEEMTGSAERIERELGSRPIHFAFPYGRSRKRGAARLRARPRGRLQDGSDDAQGHAVPRAPAASHRAATRVAERRLPVAHLYRALSFRRAVRAVESFPAGQRRVASVGALHPPDEQAGRDDPEKSRREVKGELHPLRRERDAAGADHGRGRRVDGEEQQKQDGADQLTRAHLHVLICSRAHTVGNASHWLGGSLFFPP
jgi:peptidoglycan/xylan/chitin deacetylase (PgdA/CDA1 family)